MFVDEKRKKRRRKMKRCFKWQRTPEMSHVERITG